MNVELRTNENSGKVSGNQGDMKLLRLEERFLQQNRNSAYKQRRSGVANSIDL
jgi:hypothetical protein